MLKNSLLPLRLKTPKNCKSPLRLSTRSATTISSPNDTKLTNLLARLDKFDKGSKIFDKLDELYLLSQRKGFFNLNSNNLEFSSNNNVINYKMNNLYHFNNLNSLVSNQYSNGLMFPLASTPTINDITNLSTKLSPISRTGSNPRRSPPSSSSSSITKNNSTTSTINVTINGNSISPSSISSSNPFIAKSIPGFSAFSSVTNNQTNAPVDKYLSLLQGLARNDVELKNKIEQVLDAFNNEDDFFFNYVLEFWLSGKSFNKTKGNKLHDKLGNGHLPSNLTM